MNGLKPFERTKQQTTETMPPSPNTITAAAMTTNRITSLRELLHYWTTHTTRNCDPTFQANTTVTTLLYLSLSWARDPTAQAALSRTWNHSTKKSCLSKASTSPRVTRRLSDCGPVSLRSTCIKLFHSSSNSPRATSSPEERPWERG